MTQNSCENKLENCHESADLCQAQQKFHTLSTHCLICVQVTEECIELLDASKCFIRLLEFIALLVDVARQLVISSMAEMTSHS